jgi:hypothetical protein
VLGPPEEQSSVGPLQQLLLIICMASEKSVIVAQRQPAVAGHCPLITPGDGAQECTDAADGPKQCAGPPAVVTPSCTCSHAWCGLLTGSHR